MARLSLEQIGVLLNRARNARIQASEAALRNLPDIARNWVNYGNDALAQATAAVVEYRQYCDQQKNRLEYLEGLVASWERELNEERERLDQISLVV